MIKIRYLFVFIVCLFSDRLCAQMEITNSYRDSITNRQSNVGFNSITDGCPAPPKQLNYSVIGGGKHNGNIQYQGNIGYTPANNGFFRNTQLGLIVPTLDTGEGITDFEKSISSSHGCNAGCANAMEFPQFRQWFLYRFLMMNQAKRQILLPH